ncbi:hypothetical protein Q5P01_011586 [Channa striata]|uniref:B-cell receptor CD22 n=1 Tax=Channa striata TaxID=64152 RepID=A0AA88MXS9_CHASR|nr:hypothetical protein Q5P01_011586 [Channa striata]
MNAGTLGWLVFLALIKNFSSAPIYLTLKHQKLTATEGSCINIKCEVINPLSDDGGAYWYWLKDAKWNDNDFIGTVIYSTNTTVQPVSLDFADRVKYIGSVFSTWKHANHRQKCNILICNLKKNDSGEYAFRYKRGDVKWSTNPNVTLEITENPCLITFEKPPAVMESEQITLTCSTSSSCSSSPQIEDLSGSSSSQLLNNQPKRTRTTVSFIARPEDDGKVFSCQTEGNTDEYLIRNITITVEYGPKDVSAEKSSESVREGDSVTLTCLAKGVPTPNISWVRNNQVVSNEAEWTITRIDASYSGVYHCKAQNKHGTEQSQPVTVNVTYAPDVEIQTTSSEVKEGDTVSFTCAVKRSNPQPDTYTWQKDGANTQHLQTYVVNRMKPEDSGSYTCTATNTVGTGTSPALQINVKYRPRKTNLLIVPSNARLGQPFSFTCNTDAYPPPLKYSWYRYNNNKHFDSSQWTSRTTATNVLKLEQVQREDEGIYKCNATNEIGTGDDSKEENIQVLYPPTEPILSMAKEVTENTTITISCTVESVPPSHRLTVKMASTSKSANSKSVSSQRGEYWLSNNNLQLIFNVTSADDGFYTCTALNSLGSNTSKERKLVVKYTPKDVRVEAVPGFVVKENMSLTLSCSARSYPQVNSVTWMKTTDGKEILMRESQTLTVKSASPNDIGQYRCMAKNVIGTGTSQKVQVNVKYGPKRTIVIRAAEEQGPDGKRSVTLSCSSDGYPPVKQFSWYKKGKDVGVLSSRQDYTVFSDDPGDYYCVAKNEINAKASDPVTLFDGTLMFYLKIFICIILTLLIIFIIVFIKRHRMKNSVQRGTAQPCFGFSGWSNGVRRGNLIHESILAEPFRTRDVLLLDQPYYPQAQQRQPRPDSTPTSCVNSVYSTVNMVHRTPAPAAQNPTGLQGGHAGNDSLNCASRPFGDKENNKQVKPEEDSVYAKVSKPSKKEKECLGDYENVSRTRATRPAAPLEDFDSDTSEDDVQLNYTQVSFAAKPGHPKPSSDTSSDTSSDDEIQYSDVKI